METFMLYWLAGTLFVGFPVMLIYGFVKPLLKEIKEKRDAAKFRLHLN